MGIVGERKARLLAQRLRRKDMRCANRRRVEMGRGLRAVKMDGCAALSDGCRVVRQQGSDTVGDGRQD